MTIEISNLPFKHDELDSNIDMEAIAYQMNAIEPGAGAQDAMTGLTSQMIGADSMLALAVIAGVAIGSLLMVSLIKNSPKLTKAVK